MDSICVHLLARPDGNHDLMEPLLLQDAVPEGFCSEQDLLALFRGVREEVEQRGIDAPLRVYVDGMLSLQHADRLVRSVPDTAEGIQDWMERTLAVEQFGIVLNDAERWADGLTRRARTLFRPVVEHWGAAETAIELVLFAGNYGHTPFGVHLDDEFTQTVHFQLSGCGKSMTLYDPETYARFAAGAKRYFAAEELPPGGQTYSMPAGSVFLLPAGWYHVGSNQDFSIGLAIAPSHFPPREVARQAMQHALQASESPGWLDLDFSEDEDKTCREWMRCALETMTARQKSKGSFARAVVRRPFQLDMDDQVCIDRDFPPQVLVRNTRLIVFCRGHRIETGMQEAKLRVLERLLSANSSTIRVLLHQEKTAVPSAVLALLSEMGACGGLLHVTP
jgi:hypothetical protein